MGFYFCSGIFLCFMCVITLPIFSTGKPCSDEETSNNKSNQIDVEELFKKRNEIDDDEFEALTEKNEKENPIAFYCAQLVVHEYQKNQEYKADEFNLSEIKEIIDQLYALEGNDDSDKEEGTNEIICYTIFQQEFFRLKCIEDAYYERFREGDTKENGTVSKEYAKKVILSSKLNIGQLKDDKLDDLLNKYTNQDNEFNYNDMKKNTLNDYEGDKSFIYCYDGEKNDWVPYKNLK